MLRGLLSKVVGDSNEREVRKLQPLVEAINALETEMERRIEALASRTRQAGAPFAAGLTREFRGRLVSGDSLDDLMVEAFAAVREVAKRTVDMRPFDVQLIGGIVLHQGKVAEMRTGEGKTLVATLPVYLNALSGRGVHLVTVNDYLARRDALWMGPIYYHLGLSVGLLQSGREQPAYLYDPAYQRDPFPGLRPAPRQEAYAADVTYGTNNEFGFDYLRDNLALSLERRVQRPLYYAIVDEVDNIFIDEARTPLIISGPSGESVEDYGRFAAIAPKLEPDLHYELDEKQRTVFLTDEGLAVVEQETGIENIYDEANYRYVHYMQQALKAQVLFQEGRDYIRQRKQIILVDQHTGRLMPSRRLSEGLHQAIEAKEGVPVQPRDVTSATITIQNYFRMYEKLAGMSGTAVTEAEEFFKIYNLDVLAIPTNEPVIRTDRADVVYRSEEAKLRAVAREILAFHSRGQPVLVGTTSVEMSERLSRRLTGERLQMAALAPRAAYALQDGDQERDERGKLRETVNTSLETINPGEWNRTLRALGVEPNTLSSDNLSWLIDYLELPPDAPVRRALEGALRGGIPHEVLNAKEHTREAGIIAGAGEPGAVTIATNMAGRGVDIKLGGELTVADVHRAHQAMRALGLNPFKATPEQMDSAIAQVAPQYARNRERVLEAGGLHVLGTERHEARRIDNQLRGRSGRQGEPGSSRFYLSLEDDLMRRFGRREMLSRLMEQIGDDFPIEHNLVSRTLERAQTSVEGHNFDIRKHLLEYDDVLNRQRETIYAERLHILRAADVRSEVWRMLDSQVDQYLEAEDPGKGEADSPFTSEERRVRTLFAGLDDLIPLILPSPTAPFQGPVHLSGQLTAFPPFTVGFLADQLTAEPAGEVQASLRTLIDRAAERYGEQVRLTVRDIVRSVVDKYEERLDRYRALLDEKIDDYEQLSEERGQPPDVRRLAQYVERTYPLRLNTPRLGAEVGADDLRETWLEQVEVEYHRVTCLGLVDRVLIRLPADIRLDRVRPARMSEEALRGELGRVLDVAIKQARAEGEGPQSSGALPEPPRPGADLAPDRVEELIEAIKGSSEIEMGRLDRLVSHVLGARLDEMVERHQEEVATDDGRLGKALQRIRDGLEEGRRGGRASLVELYSQLGEVIHLEIDEMERVLSLAVGHEYDKWAQRQLGESESAARQARLRDSSWRSITEYLLAALYTQKQAYDRDHRRRTVWMPRLPLNLLGQAYVEGWEAGAVREAALVSLGRCLEQREETWGRQELQRWNQTTIQELDDELYDGLIRYLGEEAPGPDDWRDDAVEDLEPELYERLRFILALRRLEDRPLGELSSDHSRGQGPGDGLLGHLGQRWVEEMLDLPVRELEAGLRDRVVEQMRRAGALDDGEVKSRLRQQRLGDWAPETREEASAFLGRRYIEAHAGESLRQLEPAVQAICMAFLKRQQAFVDESRVQRFLVHERLGDLPPDTAWAALLHLARSRLESLSRRKISNLDVATRSVVVESLQRRGYFTDAARRERWWASFASVADLEPALRTGLGRTLARQSSGGGRRLPDLEAGLYERALARLRRSDALADEEQLERLPDRRLADLDAGIAEEIGDELLAEARQDLATKTMEELPEATRQVVHDTLVGRDYFVDDEKVGWYERKTLAQLPSDLMQGLEHHLGEIRLEELGDTPFRDLPPETREILERAFDSEGVLGERAERLRLTQTGSLVDLADEDRAAVARQVGRLWLVAIRDRRPTALADGDREAVWAYLRSQGTFTDEFKEELFAYQRLDEFDAETQRAAEAAVVDRLAVDLRARPIGKLRAGVQSRIRQRLREAGFLVDQVRLEMLERQLLGELPVDLGEAVEEVLGGLLLEDLDGVPVGEWSRAAQEALRLTLDDTGYFLDERKQRQVLDRRLVDLDEGLLDPLAEDLARHLEAEIGDQPVAELSDEMRQGLREALAALDVFESLEVRERVLSQPLGSLRREDQEALAVELGRAQLAEKAGRRLVELSEEEQEALVSHLQRRDWFLDRSAFDRMLNRPLREAAERLGPGFGDELRQGQVERLRRRELGRLEPDLRQAATRYLREQGLRLEETQMRPLRGVKVRDLDREVYDDLLRDLGAERVEGWRTTPFRDLAEEQREAVATYLGRTILGRIERRVLLYTISRLWVGYLTDIEDLRRGIGLEAFGQRDPLVEYKRKAFELFEELGNNIRWDVVRSLFRQLPEPLAESRS